MAEIRFDFLGNADDLVRETERVDEALGDAEKGSDDFAKAAKIGLGIATAAAVATAAAMVKVGKEVIALSAQANRYAKAAKKIGATATDIQRVEGAFALLTENGVNAGKMIQDLNRGLAEARDGAGPAKDALGKLGLAAADLVGLPVAEQIQIIGTRIHGLGDIANQTQVSMDLFGRSGRELVGAFREGGDAVSTAFEQIEAAGIISNETAAQSEALQDSIELLGREFGTLKRGALEPLIPQMGELIAVIRQTVVEAQKSDAFKDMARFLLDVASGAALASREMLSLFGVINKTESGPGGIFADSEELRAQVKEINILQEALDAAQATAEQYADESGAWRESDLLAWEWTNDALREAQQEYKKLKEEVSELVATSIVLPDVILPDMGGGGVGEDGPPTVSNINPMAAMGAAALAQQEAFAAAHVEAQARMREALEQTEEAYEDHTAGVLAAESEMWEELGRTRESEHTAEMGRLVEEERARARQFSAFMGTAKSVFSAVGDFATAAAQKGIDALEAQGKSAKQARQDLWGLETGFAIAQAGINVPLAISNAISNSKSPQEMAINGALAAVASGAALAGVIAKAAVGPFHSGGIVPNLGPDERMTVTRAGEGHLTPQAVNAIGGPGAVNAANRGESPNMQPMVVALHLGSRVIDLQHREALRRSGGPLRSALRASQPERLGRHSPFGGR